MPRHENRPRLGRGLSSLIRRSDEADPLAGEYRPASDDDPTVDPSPAAAPAHAARPPAPGATMMTIPLGSIRRNPYQPRRHFDEATLQAMAQSIRTHGLLQPVVVCEAGIIDGEHCFELIAGERRLRAAELAGIPELPAIVRPTTPQQMLELALVENIHRDDLNPLERATAYRDLIDRFSMTQQDAADRLGQARPSLANYLRLLDLCDQAQALIADGSLSFGHGKVLAGLAGHADLQAKLARRAASENLSVRRLEVLVAQAGGAPPQGQAEGQAPARSRKPPHILDLERQLADALGARVEIRPGRSAHTGRIVVQYHGLDDFDRIIAALGLTLDS